MMGRSKPPDARWVKWSAEQHVDEAQRLSELGHHDRANVHATLAVRKQLTDVARKSFVGGAG